VSIIDARVIKAKQNRPKKIRMAIIHTIQKPDIT